MMIPADFSLFHAIAMLVILLCWLSYSRLFKMIGKTTISQQLWLVRNQWVHEITQRQGKPFDAIMLGHIVHSVAFFGSATLILLAGIFSIFASLESIHMTLSGLHFIKNTSLELFAIQYIFLASILTICFFSFTYALRKLIYAIALIGALPETPVENEKLEALIENTTEVLSEALKSFNFGIRGFYYAIAAMGLFVSPFTCLAATLIFTILLVYRQSGSKTSRAIQKYISVSNGQVK